MRVKNYLMFVVPCDSSDIISLKIKLMSNYLVTMSDSKIRFSPMTKINSRL